jgi:hypothetical protein
MCEKETLSYSQSFVPEDGFLPSPNYKYYKLNNLITAVVKYRPVSKNKRIPSYHSSAHGL